MLRCVMHAAPAAMLPPQQLPLCLCSLRTNTHAHTHRYGIAADLVQELLPDLRTAAVAAPGSLVWPPATGGSNGTAARGHAALANLAAVAVWLRFSSLRCVWHRVRSPVAGGDC
jgi:hypothetical protein